MESPSLLVLGSGNAFNDDGRGSPCLLVRPGEGSPYLVDVGPTAMGAIMRFGVEPERIDRVFFTHLHGDHLAGWPFLLLNLVYRTRRDRPLEVYGPVGVGERLQGLTRMCYRGLLDPAKLGFAIRYRELEVREARGLDGGGMTFDVRPMEHHETSIAFRFEVGGRGLAVSGDTGWCGNLEALARASDILVLECSTLREVAPGHVSLEEIRRARGRLGPCRLLLVHLSDEVASDLAADPLPGVSAGYDGMSFPLSWPA